MSTNVEVWVVVQLVVRLESWGVCVESCDVLTMPSIFMPLPSVVCHCLALFAIA